MRTSKILISLVAVFAVIASIFLASSASAFAEITDISVNGYQHYLENRPVVSVYAGDTIPISVSLQADSGIGSAHDVRITARLVGEGVSVSTPRFILYEGSVESWTLNMKIPFDIDPREDAEIEITVENRNNGTADSETIDLEIKRESYLLEILSVESQQEIAAGETLALDLVLKNRGGELSEDAYVEAEILELGAKTKAYFGDLSAKDQSDPDKEDAVERRLFLRVPSTASPGVYDIRLTAYDSDSVTSAVKRVVITPAQGSMVVSPVNSQSFAVGEEATYSMTIVNAGNKIQVYELVLESNNGLSVQISEPIVVVPAGSSKVVTLKTSAANEGDYTFNVNVHSEGNLVQTESFMAKVEGRSLGSSSAAVVLTIILAIIFVVLLIVLIVLLTRKPEKSNEDFGESYY